MYYVPYFRYYKTVLYLFLRLFGHSSRPRTLFFLASLELLVRLLFKGVLYSRASYNSGNTVYNNLALLTTLLLITEKEMTWKQQENIAYDTKIRYS